MATLGHVTPALGRGGHSFILRWLQAEAGTWLLQAQAPAPRAVGHQATGRKAGERQLLLQALGPWHLLGTHLLAERSQKPQVLPLSLIYDEETEA